MRQAKQLHFGDLFRSRRQKGRAGLPVLSVTMNDGLVRRDTLERKTNGTLTPDQHLLIREGDIAYNMMRMWQGASGLAEKDGIVSPAYVVVAPKDGIDPLFASYWFKSDRMIYLFWAYSYGITGDRLRLYYKDFAKIPVTVPPKPEQERIGRILATVDRAMERTGRLIAAKRKLKKGLAQQLLTGQRRLPGFGKPTERRRDGRVDMPNTPPAGWDYARLEQIASFKSGGTPSKDRPDYWGGDVPWVSARDLGPHRLQKTGLTVTKAGAKAGSSIVESGAIFILVRGMTLLRDVPVGVACCPMAFNQDIRAVIPRNGINGDYLAHFMAFAAPHLRRFVTIAGHGTGRLEIDSVRAMQVALPSDDEQDRIAEVLGAADREIALLEKKLAALSELKRGLMQKLLSKAGRATGGQS